MASKGKAALGFIFITLLIDITGWGLIIPVFPKLITAVELLPVTILLPETRVALETTACPLTETCPETVMSPVISLGAAKATIEVTHQKATAVRNVNDLYIKFLLSI